MGTRFQNPKRVCDLVMKGGITSGVVYPPAVLKLAKDYRFRNIGGGSVGAIAAALTAAAELNRENCGFEKLECEQKKLQENEFFVKLFRPTENTRPLMDTLLALAREKNQKGWLGFLLSLKAALQQNNSKAFRNGKLRGLTFGTILGSLLGTILVILLGIAIYLLFFVVARSTTASLGGWLLILPILVFGPIVLLGALFGALCGWLGGPLWSLYDLFRILTKKIPEENYYGMCIGHGDPNSDHPLLTDWLSDLLNDLAGRKNNRQPLTFSDLKRSDRQDADITLRMMTTNLNHQEPYVFPRESTTFIFDEEEMRQFFPGSVVDYMKCYAARKDVRLEPGLYFLPKGDALPIIVAVRMAISFPILLSAVPLYTIKSASWAQYQNQPYELRKNQDLQKNWFSDGGICSNFPIHFFDTWIPRCPTFGINLTSLIDNETVAFSVENIDETAAGPTANDTTREKVWLPEPTDAAYPEWKEFKDLLGFGEAIFYSAQNYRDTMQSRLPSYKERIVQVRLSAQEGGLNLVMKPKTIRKLQRRGEKAAKLLKRRFEEGSGSYHHRWVRLRVLLSQLDAQLERTKDGLNSTIDERLVDRQLEGGYPYPLDRYHSKKAKKLLKELHKLVRRLEQSRSNQGAPATLVRYLKQSRSNQGTLAATEESCLFPSVTTNEELRPTLRITPDV